MKADEKEAKSKLDAWFEKKSPATAAPDDCTSTSNQDKNYVRLHAPAHPESMPLTPTKKNSQPLAAGAGHLARFGSSQTTTKPAAALADASNEQRYVGMGGQQRPETPPHVRIVRAEFPEAPLSGISSKTTNQQSGYTDPSQFTNAADCVQQPGYIDSSQMINPNVTSGTPSGYIDSSNLTNLIHTAGTTCATDDKAAESGQLSCYIDSSQLIKSATVSNQTAAGTHQSGHIDSSQWISNTNSQATSAHQSDSVPSKTSANSGYKTIAQLDQQTTAALPENQSNSIVSSSDGYKDSSQFSGTAAAANSSSPSSHSMQFNNNPSPESGPVKNGYIKMNDLTSTSHRPSPL